MAGYHGGFGGGFGGANLNALMRQAQKLQEDMQKQKEQLETTEFSSNIGGGQVELVMFGSKKVKSLKINPQIVDPDDVEMLEDLIMAATNEALRKCEEESQAQMSKITGGLSGLGGGLF